MHAIIVVVVVRFSLQAPALVRCMSYLSPRLLLLRRKDYFTIDTYDTAVQVS